MKLRNHQFSTPQRTSDEWEHPWDRHMRKRDEKKKIKNKLKKPNPPSKEDVKRARFVDKTYHWGSGNSNIRSGD